ncbi:MAG: rhomboid family intramembrane serine protease [Pseudonocardiales bacterium]
MTTPNPRNWLPAKLGGPGKDKPASTEPPFEPSSWGGALIIMLSVVAVLWIIQIVNASNNYTLDHRLALRPRRLDGLWGVLTEPFLHASWGHLLSNSVPLIAIGWVILLSGLRTWLLVSGLVVVVGGLATWLVAPSGFIVGASGLVFGWLGYLIARAYFSRKLGWILIAAIVLLFFGTLLQGLLPSFDSNVSWQGHVCGFVAGVAAGAVLHPRRTAPPKRPFGSTPAVS